MNNREKFAIWWAISVFGAFFATAFVYISIPWAPPLSSFGAFVGGGTVAVVALAPIILCVSTG